MPSSDHGQEWTDQAVAALEVRMHLAPRMQKRHAQRDLAAHLHGVERTAN